MRVLAYTIGAFLVLVTWQRLEPLFDALASWPGAPSFVGGTVLGLAFGLTLARVVIWNGYVESDRKRAHEGVDKAHDAKRL